MTNNDGMSKMLSGIFYISGNSSNKLYKKGIGTEFIKYGESIKGAKAVWYTNMKRTCRERKYHESMRYTKVHAEPAATDPMITI